MSSLGTRKFYKAFDGSTNSEDEQILKNSGYISIVLHSVFYNSKGNFWQSIFGGIDKIALTSSITYHSSSKTIEAKVIQDKREVNSNKAHFLGLSRPIALKIPANCDGLELKVGMSAVKSDNFENGIDLMNSEEFQEPLQLSSIGQILSITKVVKKIFTGIENNSELEATFAGIVSKKKTSNPILKDRLSKGYLIMISNNDEDNNFLEELDIEKLQVEADGLKYNSQRVKHTNIIYSISFEEVKGIDENSKWFNKYKLAIAKLDDIIFANSDEEKKKILIDSRKLWVEGSALLFDDSTYIYKEQADIKALYFKEINKRYQELTQSSSENFINNFLEGGIENLDFISDLKHYNSKEIETKTSLLANNYLNELSKSNFVLPE